ncbi:MAG TPA: biotin--[acetyl-CoA-carboxylase] ligase [Acidimicrobiales bacterium]|jgi:BirA family biotin operon repressor/biotin-[acetyl-CoA-carboxylase] ligase
MADAAAKRALPGREIQWLREVDSTNLRLSALVREKGAAAHGVVIVADHQTAGRGRRGRTWEAPVGSSLLVSAVVQAPAPDLAQLTTVGAALAAADACESQAGVRPSLKWPNDLMFGASKVGGILADAVSPQAVVIGLGLNVDWGDVKLPEGATSLSLVAGAPGVGREALLASYLQHLFARCEALTEPVARKSLLENYRASCSTLGRVVRVELDTGRVTGTATDVTGRGNLVVTTQTGASEVSAGDVFHIGNP